MLQFLLPVATSMSQALKIPALAIFLGQIAANILAWFATRMTKGLAINLTIITMVVSLAAGVALTVKSLLSGLSYVVPDYISIGLSFFIPDNAVSCLSVIFAARVARWVFHWQWYAIEKVAG